MSYADVMSNGIGAFAVEPSSDVILDADERSGNKLMFVDGCDVEARWLLGRRRGQERSDEPDGDCCASHEHC